MSDIHQRLVDALREHFSLGSREEWVCGGCYSDYHNARFHDQHLADVLLSLPGIAIVDADEYKQLLELVASADTIMEQMRALLAAKAAQDDHA
jgi:hypothetical protein